MIGRDLGSVLRAVAWLDVIDLVVVVLHVKVNRGRSIGSTAVVMWVVDDGKRQVPDAKAPSCTASPRGTRPARASSFGRA